MWTSSSRGECVGLVGETGSGKSVTCRALTGMLRWLGARITRGRVLFGGRDIGAVDERCWRSLHGQHIGFIPQNSLSGLDPVMTIGAQLGETVRHLRGSRPKAPDVLALLAQVQMPHPREVYASYPHQLSGGMRQRVMIALAIAGQPELLVADEPTTALDVTVQREILDLMMDLQQRSRMGLVLVSHDLDVVARVSDQVAIMYAGATVEVGATTDVLAKPAHPSREPSSTPAHRCEASAAAFMQFRATPQTLATGHPVAASRRVARWPLLNVKSRFRRPRCPGGAGTCVAFAPGRPWLKTSRNAQRDAAPRSNGPRDSLPR